ncbi:hypothetical protein EIP91_007887 [Steccherinum ochraceum]|uniref:Carboxylic ester hydrolase n=1 Tax=Steccherinum ochraceum TaxID=92696 RepID=A0A4R0R3K4_9APHY|nr:hypothetical protein EIP91_007887 [Steccherinum ochraceum]
MWPLSLSLPASSKLVYSLLTLGFLSLPVLSTHEATSPVVAIEQGSFIGSTDGHTNRYLGIRYAQPPTGDLRFRRPLPVEPYTGTIDVSDFAPICPQHLIELPSELPPTLDVGMTLRIVTGVYNATAPQSEDCLSLNIWTPPNVSGDSKLPVAVWIHGGGFQVGSANQYDGGILVRRSIEIGEPMIFVGLNYRLSALGWLAGKEAKEAGVGNLGFFDQRLALKWIQKNIQLFGGDPTKVTIFGESAGAVSVATHMMTNNGDHEGLFRAAFMESGSTWPVGDMEGGQRWYDDLVANTECADEEDTVECLRDVPLDKLRAAMDRAPAFFSYSALSLSWGPRTDGEFMPNSGRELLMSGNVAKVPTLIGTCDDEGTAFALGAANTTTTEELRDYLSTIVFPDATQSSIDALLEAYPEDPTLGAPFGTGEMNAISPQFKRLAAIWSDLAFIAPKALWAKKRADIQDTWVYVHKRNKNVAVLGATHFTDIFDLFGPSDMTDHFIHFVSYLNPNGGAPVEVQTVFDDLSTHSQVPLNIGGAVGWPRYNSATKLKLAYMAGSPSVSVVPDTDREKQVTFMMKFLEENQMR